jgi:hypothetical protein
VTPYVALVAFLALWLGFAVGISRLSGWARLARRFPNRHAAAVTTVPRATALLGTSFSYQRMIRVELCAEGCRLSVPWSYRLGHAPIFLPWSAVATCGPSDSLGGLTGVELGGEGFRASILGRAAEPVLAGWNEARGIAAGAGEKLPGGTP